MKTGVELRAVLYRLQRVLDSDDDSGSDSDGSMPELIEAPRGVCVSSFYAHVVLRYGVSFCSLHFAHDWNYACTRVVGERCTISIRLLLGYLYSPQDGTHAVSPKIRAWKCYLLRVFHLHASAEASVTSTAICGVWPLAGGTDESDSWSSCGITSSSSLWRTPTPEVRSFLLKLLHFHVTAEPTPTT